MAPPKHVFTDFYSEGDPNCCWEWKGRKDPEGYGRFGAQWLAHRYSYKAYFSDFDDSLAVLHKCDNPGCVNPHHLFQGTQLENIADRVSKGRSSQGESHPSAKLTRGEADTIRQLFSEGFTVAELSRRYNVSRVPIYKILRGITWK